MEHDQIDDAIERDLASFTERTARVPAMPEPGEALAGPPYRDNRDGAVARRDADFDERRVELALLPLRLARVFAHRVGRAAAGAVALLGAAGLAALMSNPALMQLAGYRLPGLSLEFALAATAAGIVLAYLAALLVAERVYERRAARAVTASSDPVRDLDRARPARELVALVRRADAPSAGLSVLGIVSLIPLFAFLALDAVEHALFGFNGHAAQHFAGIARNVPHVLVAIAVFAVLACALWVACARDARGEGSRLLAVLGHWSMLVLGVVAGLFVALGWIGSVAFAEFPFTGPELVSLSLAGTAGIALPSAWAVLALRRHEQRAVRRAVGLGR